MVDAPNCYFVLLVETVEGISYRKACGEARATWWDAKKDREMRHVILG